MDTATVRPAQGSPARWQGPEGAGHHLDVDAPVDQPRDEPFEFAIAHQRVSAYEREGGVACGDPPVPGRH